MQKSFEKVHTRRLITLIVCSLLIFSLAIARVFDFQIVNGDQYRTQAQRSTSTDVTIYAARGEIVDRNGIPLTQNKVAINIELDYSFVKENELNDVLVRLITTLEKYDTEWEDELPISKTAPFTFDSERENDVARLKKKLNVNSYATADDCLEWLYKNYGIKKYENSKGKCTHCGKNFSECTFESYDDETCRKLAGIRYSMILKDFSQYNPRYIFAKEVPAEAAAYIQELSDSFIGVEINQTAVRTYVSGDVAPQIIGRVGPITEETKDMFLSNKELGYGLNDIVGTEGIEYKLENVLRGKNGKRTVVKNSKGQIISVEQTVTPVAGKTVQLSIDYLFQQELQQLFAEYINQYNSKKSEDEKCKAAALVVLDTKTGGVLASVSYPYYNINDAIDNYYEVYNRDGSPMKNRALREVYRPGSTFKPIVAAASLNENLITPQTQIYCNGTYTYWPDWVPPPRCLQDGHHHESLDVMDALKYSCNTFFYDCGRRLTIDRMNDYAQKFGLGADTGLEIPNEKGFLSSPKVSEKYGQRWEAGNVIQAAIGQLDTKVTPLQMSLEALTIANSGTRYNAHLVENILSYDTKTVIEHREPTIASQFTMTPENHAAVVEGMIRVAQRQKGAGDLSGFGYDVAIKTGSPQVNTKKFNSCFIGFAPANEPEIAISCMVENGLGSQVFCNKIITAWENAKIRAEQVKSGELVPVVGGLVSKEQAQSTDPLDNSTDSNITSGDDSSVAEPDATGTSFREDTTIVYTRQE